MTKQTKPAKRRINSKQKGNRAERELAQILTEHFGVPFARVGVASGARVKNTKLPDNAIGVMTGDLIPPAGFRFSIEAKSEKVNIDFFTRSALFGKWLTQATNDASSISKIPMLCWKRHRKGWIVAIPSKAFKNAALPPHYASYGFGVWQWDWIVCRLDTLLETNKERHFWFDEMSDVTQGLTILEQFDICCANGEGDIICPGCGVDIGQFYHWIKAANHIEHNRCPICHCDAYGEDCDGTDEWCEHCTRPCEGREKLEEQREYDAHIDQQIKAMKEWALA